MLRSFPCFRRAVVSIPQLSPTHTKARIRKWLVKNGASLENYDPIFILECSPDVVTEGLRENDSNPVMIVEAHDEGTLEVAKTLLSTPSRWMKVGEEIGIIDDEDNQDQSSSPWLWQAYNHSSDD